VLTPCGTRSRLKISQANDVFGPGVFVQVSVGFVTLWVSHQSQCYRALQNPPLASHCRLLRTRSAGCFLQVELQQDERVWWLGQAKLVQVFLSEALLSCWLHPPWGQWLEWTFRNHHVHSALCFLASLPSNGFPQRSLSDIWMSRVFHALWVRQKRSVVNVIPPVTC
jgi:hypothetical protein